MTAPDWSSEQLSGLPISKKVLAYGSVGVVSALLIQLTSGFAPDHPLLLGLGILLWIVFGSSMAWTFWEFVLPVAGSD